MKTDKTSVPVDAVRSQRAKDWHARRKAKIDAHYGPQSVGAYQSIANPTPSFKDWAVNAHGTITSYTDWLQPEFILHRYGGSFVLRESNLLAGGKSLAQDCSIPKRDENGFLIEEDQLEEAA